MYLIAPSPTYVIRTQLVSHRYLLQKGTYCAGHGPCEAQSEEVLGLNMMQSIMGLTLDNYAAKTIYRQCSEKHTPRRTFEVRKAIKGPLEDLFILYK